MTPPPMSRANLSVPRDKEMTSMISAYKNYFKLLHQSTVNDQRVQLAALYKNKCTYTVAIRPGVTVRFKKLAEKNVVGLGSAMSNQPESPADTRAKRPQNKSNYDSGKQFLNQTRWGGKKGDNSLG
eukprot:GHVT01024325.1.p1 GENE.GHVT01024325.1~~GHVT01024325.1.p1  ORF type:complete len:126 (+),score=9.67 GHVT01024325.1:315-692(+)